jgi:hypothetical protein
MISSTADLQLQLIPHSSTWGHLIITPPDNIDNNSYLNYSCNISTMDRHFNTSDHNTSLHMLTPNTTYSVHCLVYRDDTELCYEGTATGSTFPSGEYTDTYKVIICNNTYNQEGSIHVAVPNSIIVII